MEETPEKKRVIVNADDFGFSPGITAGVLRAHREGIVTSTTISANMPAACEAAARLSEFPELGVGVHLNASQGPPLSDEGRRLADDDGLMRRSAMGVVWACVFRPGLLRAVEAEFDAQIRWALDHGLKPTHLDSHRHAHAFPPIFQCVAALAGRYNIRFVRRHRERLAGLSWPAAPAGQRRVSGMLNLLGRINSARRPELLPTRGTWGVAHTGRIDAAWLRRAAVAVRPGVTEIMTHPGTGEDRQMHATRLRESRRAELQALCDGGVRRAFADHGIELTHYGRL